MKKSILIGCIFASIISGILIGIIVHLYNNSILEKATLEEVEIANKFIENQANVIQTGSLEAKTTPNTKVVFETMYLECSHLETIEQDIDKEDINKDEEFFKDKYNDWKIKSFSEEKVELYKENQGICNKHYVVKENNGYIAVYTLDSQGNQNLKEVTDIVTTYLPEEDIKLLEKGIMVNGDIELARTLSDFE